MSEPQLKYDNARVVNCWDLDKFVNIHLEGFGLTWRALESNPYDGYHNGSYEQADPVYGMEVEDSTDQDFDRWLLGGTFYGDEAYGGAGGVPSSEHMLQWLCNMGAVDEGKYVIHMWW
jgi:hypothetical protein